MKTRGLSCALAVAVALPCSILAQEPAPEVVARCVAVLDSFTGEFLFEKAARQRCHPASTTKILTALLIIEAGDLDRTIKTTAADIAVSPTIIGLRPGDGFSRRELLYALMLRSANDAAMALARDHSGSVSEFCRCMNARARALGALSSNFVNPHGLPHAQHYSTARDLALITRAALNLPAFRHIVSTNSYLWRSADGKPLHLVNRNRLLVNYPGCTGVKTGYTRSAGQVLVSSALRDGIELISVVLNTSNTGIWEDSAALLDGGFELLARRLRERRPWTIAADQIPPSIAGR